MGSVCFGLGVALSNLLLISGSLQADTLTGYLLAAVISGGLTWKLRSGTLRVVRYLDARAGLTFRDVVAAGCAIAGTSVGLIDGLVWPDRYWNIHLVLTGLTVAFFSTFALALASRRRLFLALGAVPFVISLITLPSLTAVGVEGLAAHSMSHLTLHRRLVLVTRSFFDRDGDGFSPVLGGGDCDDDDPRAFPLSLTGRDCLGWGPATELTLEPPAFAPTHGATSERAPRLILLVTIDAFRCGALTGSPPLLDACPNLTRLAGESRVRSDAHSSYPATRNAFGSLHTAEPCFLEAASPRFLLARWLSDRGYRTHALSVHENQLPSAVKGSFDTVDEHLVAQAALPTAVTSELVTDRGLAYLREHTGADRPPLFVWLHYFDTHAPYVETPGSSWVKESELGRYAREVRRVDVAIARLVQGLRQLEIQDSTLMLLTADHGEEFGENGFYRHGSSIYEEAIQIPMLVWSPSRELLASVPKALPANHAEVSAFLIAALTGQPFSSAEETFSWVHSPDSTAFGLYLDGRKLIYNATDNRIELFDLRRDPFERTDLSLVLPGAVRQLSPRLLAYLRHCEVAARGRYRPSGLLQTWLSPRPID